MIHPTITASTRRPPQPVTAVSLPQTTAEAGLAAFVVASVHPDTATVDEEEAATNPQDQSVAPLVSGQPQQPQSDSVQTNRAQQRAARILR
jgi:hypothetical protein